MFDSVTKALTYLRESVSMLWNTKTVLEDRLTRIARAMQKAQDANNQPALGKLIILKAQTEGLLREHESLWVKLNPFRDWFASNTVGVFPIWLAAGGIGLATTLYLFFEKVRNDGKTLELIERGILTPKEAAALTGGGFAAITGNLGTILMWGAILYGAIMIVPAFTKRAG